MAYLSLTSENQRNIQAIIRSWNGKLTWNLLINKITNELEIKTTRQTLNSYLSIKNEYQLKKYNQKKEGINLLVNDSYPTTNLEIENIKLKEKTRKLEAKIEILEQQCGSQLKLIETIFENASRIPNLDLNYLIEGT
ncbi:hypothetical protein GLP30_03745 [Photobacterium phosphoreum]|uniref:Uncharacterized protein n=1 Tax=Photobacterium phosphoreum TaxID=659 RepID=A0AAW4ZPF6_PHOPO|nr:hypothetical protein [Photobacterium phosphoreum]MCD9489941.1 hypothetical protein [Photobacterium phosphoreum]MCF2189207.1 hypothetical protein [Photobacterium phosphoreum]MCF2301078.1 hypothetical protein [Photobacterium phosphoreum]